MGPVGSGADEDAGDDGVAGALFEAPHAANISDATSAGMANRNSRRIIVVR